MFTIGSMCGIFTYIYHKHQPNIGTSTIQSTIHGWYGFTNHELFERQTSNCWLPSLKPTAKAPKNRWLEYDGFLLGYGLFVRGRAMLV